MTPSTNYLLTTIKSILHNEPMPASVAGTSASSDAIDYTEVYRMAVRSSVANLVAFGICKDEFVPTKVRDAFDKERLKNIMHQTQQAKAIEELGNIFAQFQAKGLILKGSVLKTLYPDPFMRSMADVDFFMEEADIHRISNAIIAAGYETGSQGANDHYVFTKGLIDIEIHSDLEPFESSYATEVFKKRFPDATSISSAVDVWAHAEPYNDSSYMLQLTPEYNYLHVVLHMMKHFLSSGTGIRSFIDIWVMNQHYGLSWDREALNALLERFGLLRFEQYALALADRWFSVDADIMARAVAPSVTIEPDALDALEEFILDSGTYGNQANHILKEMRHDTAGASKIKYLFKAMFRPYKTMKGIYPVLEKVPVLLPFMWLYRPFEIFAKRGKQARSKLKVVATADQEKAEKIKGLFEKVI